MQICKLNLKPALFQIEVGKKSISARPTARPNLPPYNIAVADWFNRPEILEVDLSAWNGAPGGMIYMRVQDDVLVAGVTVTISDSDEIRWKTARRRDRHAVVGVCPQQ